MIGYAVLIGAVVIWALSYIVMKSATSDYPQLLFQFWRYAGVTVLYVVCFRHAIKGMSRAIWKFGFFKLGPANYIHGFFSIYAVAYTTPTRVVVINSLIVGAVPLLRRVHEKCRPERGEKWAIAISLAAITFLLGPQTSDVRLGDGLAFIGMLGYAYSIILTNRLLVREGASVIQASLLVVTGCAVYFSVTAFAYASFHPVGLGFRDLLARPVTVAGILYMILFVSFAANLLQVAGQQRLSPVTVSILFCLEPAVTALFDYFLLGNPLSITLMLSGALLVFASLLAVKPSKASIRVPRNVKKSKYNA